MTGGHVNERTYGHVPIIGPALSQERFFIKIPEKNEVGLTHQPEFVGDIIQVTFVVSCVRSINILVVTGQFHLIISRKTQGAVGHDPLGVDDVSHHILDRPFTGSIAEILKLLGNIGKDLLQIENGILQLFHHAVTGNQFDVLLEKFGVFTFIGTCNDHTKRNEGGSYFTFCISSMMKSTSSFTYFLEKSK